MPTTYTAELIAKLKAVKEEQNLSVQNICDMLDAAHYHVSINTIKKVFSEGSEFETFNLHNTIQPLSRVLLGIYGKDQGDPVVDALHAAVRVKDERIDTLERELLEVKTEHSRKNTFLMEQIKLKDERIDKLMSRVDILLQQLQRLLDRCDNCTNRSDQP